jgi:hypothetical protein
MGISWSETATSFDKPSTFGHFRQLLKRLALYSLKGPSKGNLIEQSARGEL